MKADERWRPTTQKPEQQVCHQSHDEYLDFILVLDFGSSNMMIMLMTMMLKALLTSIMMNLKKNMNEDKGLFYETELFLNPLKK